MLRRGFAFLFFLVLASAQAQTDFPARAMRIVVGFPPGGSSDVTARLVAERMSEEWKQPVLIDNKAGAGGTIAAAYVAAAPPDGYALLHVGPGTHAITSALYKDLSYDALKSFAGVGQIAISPFVVVVNASSSVKSMKELLELAKARPGQVSYASSGSGAGPNVVTEIVALSTGVQFLHVPFKGYADGAIALMGGHVMAQVDSTGWAKQVDAGAQRLLATLGDKRTRWGAPTVSELGVDTVSNSPFGLVGPKGMSPQVVKTLHDAFKLAIDDPENHKALQLFDQSYWYKSSEDYARWAAQTLKAERATIERVGLLAN